MKSERWMRRSRRRRNSGMLKESDAVEWKRGRRRRSRAKENLEERPQRQDPDSSCFHTRTGTDCPAMCPAEITERETKRTTNTSLEPQMEKLQAECTTRLRLLTTVRPRSTAFDLMFSPTIVPYQQRSVCFQEPPQPHVHIPH